MLLLHIPQQSYNHFVYRNVGNVSHVTTFPVTSTWLTPDIGGLQDYKTIVVLSFPQHTGLLFVASV